MPPHGGGSWWGISGGRGDVRRPTRSVGEFVVREDRLLVLGEQFAVRADRGRFPDLLLAVGDLQMIGTYRRAVQGDEHQPVAGRQADRDRRERGLVCGRVNVDRLQEADLVPLVIDHIVAAPLLRSSASNMGLPLSQVCWRLLSRLPPAPPSLPAYGTSHPGEQPTCRRREDGFRAWCDASAVARPVANWRNGYVCDERRAQERCRDQYAASEMAM